MGMRMLAEIEWIRPEDGGRSKPPSGEGSPRYATIVRFAESAGASTLGEAWSLVVEKVEALNPYSWVAEVRFLVDAAPMDLLASGRTFELYEGHKRVATGKVR